MRLYGNHMVTRKFSRSLVVAALVVVFSGAVMACILPGVLMADSHAHGSASMIGHIEHAKQLTQASAMTVLLVGLLFMVVAAALSSYRMPALPALISHSSYRPDRIPISRSLRLRAWLSLLESSPTTFRSA
ncbi:hypothetical protein A3C20_01335 [Candidatus Kaiserbacteria bacterium RIFCSPHIGHO2_02_FULL_55_25]|uniref:Uncharacterized protein n=1 Tax=Candidatus Kaiserbacteria bacterium RIFCSPHIGHO2_02_FULL_55_25 TaxID=1798498 RepID=A0A1F6EAP2_9BACT|nr:MAG: hypothetical protein A2764_00435 [Candidatus Kaiserbacteria bacterium RIFCSPHIGHO2_01_FULL_55_79]OGG70640.1 MAG: hypothetical protein A3C20_01335 [Candidatus Kaiserbacteria bacterium RIFCSPHIGHO2_02_FULL_55_25]OGG78754.1 MAG: hypothetical protein A3F56_00895 [Candidatus Kaiserbacteria bacterium RIFCSPHIGHO2_12_FULL_55_13]OGG82716.1 MAG: hypothetical protein A3A42_02500 [Candidatus Kaiserbacteria bacterium RIFCSPLOWO2_01_FULL_55_25]